MHLKIKLVNACYRSGGQPSVLELPNAAACLSWHPFIGSDDADCVLRSTVAPASVPCALRARATLIERLKAMQVPSIFLGESRIVSYKE